MMMESGTIFHKDKLHGKKYLWELMRSLEEVPESGNPVTSHQVYQVWSPHYDTIQNRVASPRCVRGTAAPQSARS